MAEYKIKVNANDNGDRSMLSGEGDVGEPQYWQPGDMSADEASEKAKQSRQGGKKCLFTRIQYTIH